MSMLWDDVSCEDPLPAHFRALWMDLRGKVHALPPSSDRFIALAHIDHTLDWTQGVPEVVMMKNTLLALSDIVSTSLREQDVGDLLPSIQALLGFCDGLVGV